MKRLALAAGLLAAFGLEAADHLDAPAVMNDPAADINDYYAFINPNDPQELVAVITLNPLATGATQFSDAILYDFWFVNSVGAASSVQCRFSADQRVNCTGPDERSVGGPVGQTNSSGDFRVWAGLRDDPFFFDLQAFQDTVATGVPAFTSPGTDFFAGLNTLAIVIGIDIDAISPEPDAKGHYLHQTYASSARIGGTGITGDVNGFWWDAANPGEGWNFEVFNDEQGGRFLSATFYTFDPDGNRYWLAGDGPIDGNSATLSLSTFSGGSFGAALPEGTVTGQVHGTATVSFDSCTSGSVDYVPDTAFAEFGQQDYVLDSRPTTAVEDCTFFVDSGQSETFGKAHLAFQKDRMGRPAISTALIPAGSKDAYNAAADPSTWVEMFSGDIAASLAVYDGIDGETGNLLLGDAQALANVLADDRLVIALNVPECGPYLAVELTAAGDTPSACGGRPLATDVIDATLGAAVGVPVSDGVDANDRAFLDGFPFLASPN